MRCTSPRTVGFADDGKTIVWSQKQANKEYASFQLPCGKCLECRLEYARSWAVRCVHEAQMHPKNAFVTLTYSPEHLTSEKLVYRDFQLFMKKIRKLQNDPIGVFVTGEYGEENKRPHWHAILFNWSPTDAKEKYKTKRGDQVWESETLSKAWGKGTAEFGSVTFESAGYCARYAAKKLVHGKDGEHDYQPISKKSSKHAIGKKWLEKYWEDIFLHGECRIRGGTSVGIPRYYEKWLKENKPREWLRYVTEVKPLKSALAAENAAKIKSDYLRNVDERGPYKRLPLTPNEVRRRILQSKFKMLQDCLKL